MTLIERLQDILKQATQGSHYYVAATVRDAIAELKRLYNREL